MGVQLFRLDFSHRQDRSIVVGDYTCSNNNDKKRYEYVSLL